MSVVCVRVSVLAALCCDKVYNVDRGVQQAMWRELAGQVDTAINSLSANHAYLKTLYTYMQPWSSSWSVKVMSPAAMYRS